MNKGMNVNEIAGKTVAKVTHHGDGYLEIEFTDGSKLAVYTSSSSWLSVDFSD